MHADGAFSDQQAPGLNRRLRGRAYELMIAVERHEPGQEADPLTVYLRQLAGRRRGILAFAALRGAMAIAVDEFAAAEGIDAAVAHDLAREAGRGALSGFKLALRLHHGDARTERHFAYLLNMIPDYWEPPVVSPEFRRLLDATREKKNDATRRVSS